MEVEGPTPIDASRKAKRNAKARVITKSVMFDSITIRRLTKLGGRKSSFSNIAYQAIQRGLSELEAERQATA